MYFVSVFYGECNEVDQEEGSATDSVGISSCENFSCKFGSKCKIDVNDGMPHCICDDVINYVY